MKILTHWVPLLSMTVVLALTGCSNTTKSPAVSSAVRKALDQAGLKKVSVDQDRDKGVVTLGGQVSADGDKAQAESIAKSVAAGQVVSNQIAVVSAGAESDTRTVYKDLDKGIADNLDAALIQAKLHDGIKFSVKNQVVTLTGDVDSEAKRAQVQSTAGTVPNVQQVVNELQVKNQKASSTE
jgi:hyperosmotically inducible periplasmic protein